MSAAGCAAVLVAAAVGCSGDDPKAPRVLVDGSPARPPPVALEGVEGPSIATSVRGLARGAVDPGSNAAACLGSSPDREVGAAVERVGVSGWSVTFRGAEPGEVRGCDAVATPPAGEALCGHAYARLRAGVLRDPRLSVTCRNVDDEPVGFAWVQPLPSASYVAVAGPAYHEVYRVSAGLPVRVTTTEVDVTSASAAFSISEHARDGRRLRSYELDARVSG